MSTNTYNANMITDPKWSDLYERHEMAYFRGQLATSDPASYSVDEMREISEAMDASTAEVEAELRNDFNAMPPKLQTAMLDLLQKADLDGFDWWLSVLVGDMPTTPEELQKARA